MKEEGNLSFRYNVNKNWKNYSSFLINISSDNASRSSIILFIIFISKV